jgi:putative transposase
MDLKGGLTSYIVRMSIPLRGNTGHGTYFVTSSTFQKKQILHADRMASLLVAVFRHYNAQGKYLLHEYVVMPDHFHVLITPVDTLERSVQLIKGGFSFRAKKEVRFGGEVWQNSFYDRRVRNWEEYEEYRTYILNNPVKRGLVGAAEDFAYSSKKLQLDGAPQRLKPEYFVEPAPQR